MYPSPYLLHLSEKLLTQTLFEAPPSLVLEAQIAEATHKGDAQDVEVPTLIIESAKFGIVRKLCQAGSSILLFSGILPSVLCKLVCIPKVTSFFKDLRKMQRTSLLA